MTFGGAGVKVICYKRGPFKGRGAAADGGPPLFRIRDDWKCKLWGFAAAAENVIVRVIAINRILWRLPSETMKENSATFIKLSYFGHIKRHITLEKLFLKGTCEGRRGRGRPRRRWTQGVIGEWMGVSTVEAGRQALVRGEFRQAVWEATSIKDPP